MLESTYPVLGQMKNRLQTRGMELGRKGIFSVVQNGQVSILFLCKKLILGVFLSRQYDGTRSSYSTKCIPDQDMASTVVASPLYRKAWPYARELPSSLLQHPVKPRSLSYSYYNPTSEWATVSLATLQWRWQARSIEITARRHISAKIIC